MAVLANQYPRIVSRTVPGNKGNPINTLPAERMREKRPDIVSRGTPDLAPVKSRTSREKDEEILVAAKKRFQTSQAAETHMRNEMLEDLRFRAGHQWPDQIESQRTNEGRPIITINRLPQFVKQITNPQRQSRPSIQINPVGDGADVDTAEVIQGLIRHIENTSHAEVAYDSAYEDAVVTGRGWFRILTEYAHDGSFDQEIVVRRIPNPFTVYVDPSCQELDYSDARYMFVVEDIPKDEYKTLYGDDSASSLELFQSVGDRQPDWYPEGKIRIAEYFYVEMEDRQIALIRDSQGDPMVVPKSRVPKGVPIERERTVQQRVVHWVKMNGAEVLEHKIWPGNWIPLVPILGDEINLNGEKDLVGIVRFARDPQRMYNYWVSAETEMIALAPKAPFIGVEGQFKGHEAEWKSANNKAHAYLEYAAVSLDGKPAPPPQRNSIEPPIQAIVAATKQADNDLKAVIGFYDASLGQPGPDQSGKAILARQKQGETGNLNFIDNLGRALWHAGRIYLDLIPHIYDAPRVIHIMRADDQRAEVTINEPWMDPKKGVEKLIDVRTGRYNVTMSIGPNYQTKRQEAVASMLQLVQADPQIIAIIGDLMVSEMDWPNARQISERLKKMLPPQLQENPDGGPPIPPQVQQQMAAAQQQIQVITAEYQKVVDLLKTKKIETESKERIAILNTQAQVAVAMARYGSEADHKILDHEFQRFTQQVDMLHERMLAQDDRDHQIAMQAAGAGADHAGQAADQQHEQMTQAADQQHQQMTQAADQQHQAGMQQADQQHAQETQGADHAHEQQLAKIAAATKAAQRPAGPGA